MPQSAQHGFRLQRSAMRADGEGMFQCLNRHSMGSDDTRDHDQTVQCAVSMPQSAQHGFRLSYWTHDMLGYFLFQCLNRHSMGSDSNAVSGG